MATYYNFLPPVRLDNPVVSIPYLDACGTGINFILYFRHKKMQPVRMQDWRCSTEFRAFEFPYDFMRETSLDSEHKGQSLCPQALVEKKLEGSVLNT